MYTPVSAALLFAGLNPELDRIRHLELCCAYAR